MGEYYLKHSKYSYNIVVMWPPLHVLKRMSLILWS